MRRRNDREINFTLYEDLNGVGKKRYECRLQDTISQVLHDCSASADIADQIHGLRLEVLEVDGAGGGNAAFHSTVRDCGSKVVAGI